MMDATTLPDWLAPELNGASAPARRFFAFAFTRRHSLLKGRDVARALGLNTSTLTSRLYRAGLPSLRDYMAHARLILLAEAFAAAPRRSIAAIGRSFGWPFQSNFAHHIMLMTGDRRCAGVIDRALRSPDSVAQRREWFVAHLVQPYRDHLVAVPSPFGFGRQRVPVTMDGQTWPIGAARPASAWRRDEEAQRLRGLALRTAARGGDLRGTLDQLMDRCCGLGAIDLRGAA